MKRGKRGKGKKGKREKRGKGGKGKNGETEERGVFRFPLFPLRVRVCVRPEGRCTHCTHEPPDVGTFLISFDADDADFLYSFSVKSASSAPKEIKRDVYRNRIEVYNNRIEVG